MNNYFTKRRARKRAIWLIVSALEEICHKEKGYFYSIPITMANRGCYIESEHFIATLDGVIESLHNINNPDMFPE